MEDTIQREHISPTEMEPEPDPAPAAVTSQMAVVTDSERRSSTPAPPEPFLWNKSRDPRPLDKSDIVLLFDLNGTLTSHTTNRTGGKNNLRPGTEHLLKLKGRFRLGIYSSSTQKTVEKVLIMMWRRLGEHIFDPDLIFYRDHTKPINKRFARLHRLKPWDTVKPLAPLFGDLDRVVLFDDDPWKAVLGEERNMVVVPSWKIEDPEDPILPALVGVILEILSDLPISTDLRSLTQHLHESLSQHSGGMTGNVVPLGRSRSNGLRERDQW